VAPEFTPVEGNVGEGTSTDTGGTSFEGLGVGSTPDTTVSSPGESYTVKIDGQEVSVSLDELLKGYQRQSDYTRKTQALAAERSQMDDLVQLANALNTDPAGTIQILQEAYGLTKAQAQAVVDEQAELDPEEARWQQVEQFMRQQEEERRQQAIASDIQQLKQRYGDFDENEIIKHALENRIPNLRAAFADYQFQRLEAAKAQRLQEERQKTEAKKDAQVVSGAANTQRGVIAPGAGGAKKSIRQAFENSKRELGWS